MTDDQINKIAEQVANKVIKYIDKKQKEFEEEYFKSIESQIFYPFDNQNNSINYIYTPDDSLETLKNELAILENILKVHIDKEEYKEAAIVRDQIEKIKTKLNKK